MKVEFVETSRDGIILCISASEFIKANKSTDELVSLSIAIDSFCRLFGESHIISKDEYQILNSRLDKTGKVVIFPNSGSNTTSFEINVVNGNFSEPVVIFDEDRHRVLARVNREPKVLTKKIRKNHNE